MLPVGFVAAQQTLQQQKDSLRRTITLTEGEEKLKTYPRLYALYVPDIKQEHVIDTMLAICDELDAEALRQGMPNYRGLARTNKLSALLNRQLLDEVIQQAPEYLAFDVANNLWKHYFQAHFFLMEAYRRKGEYEQALREAQTSYDHAKELQDAGGMGMAFYAMSRIYGNQRRSAESEKCLREVIVLLQDSAAYLHILANCYTSLGFHLVALERYGEALQIAAESEAVNRRYEEASKSPHANVWWNTWRVYLEAYRQSGEFDKAEIYLNKVDSITHGSSMQYEERTAILKGRKRYREALEMVNKALATDIVSRHITLKGEKLDILIYLCEADSAVLLFREVIADMDVRNNLEINAQLDEIRTQYEVERHIAEKARNRNYFLFALGGCILLLVLLGIGFYYNRVVTGKNRGLYRQIREQDSLNEELEQLAKRYDDLLTSVPPSVKVEVDAEKERPGDRQQKELVKRLNKYLLNDKNIIKPDIDLDGLVSELATNRSSLFEAVKTVTGKTLMEYIHTLQLNEARQMMDTHPDLTVETIAADCGFNNRQTFYRLFKEQYNISPAEYRKMVKNR
jgi:AraC-like DNA-binding protein